MNIIFDLHTHTTYSRAPIGTHGKGTVAENAASALKKGIGVSITDHGPGHSFYGIRPSKYGDLKNDIEKENEKAGFKAVLSGTEANILDAEGRTDIEFIPTELDVLLMGYHKGVRPRKKAGRQLLFPCMFNKEKAKPILTEAIIASFDRYPIDLLTHPGEYVPLDIEKVAKAAVERGIVLEINNRHPISEEYLKTAYSLGAYFILSSDAHLPENVGKIDNAAEFVKRMKIPPERIVNSDAYTFDTGLRIDKLKSYAQGLSILSTTLRF